MADAVTPTLRLDKWLWAARFFKTRALAADAVGGGKVKVNGERAKPAKSVRAGDVLTIHVGPYEYVITVRSISDRRGPASQAALLYEESITSKAARDKLAQQLALGRAAVKFDPGRPTREARREAVRLKKSYDQ